MTSTGFRYTKVPLKILLSKAHKEKRFETINEWEKTSFSDEKRFSLDCPDDWWTYIMKNKDINRQKKQCQVGVLWFRLWVYLMDYCAISLSQENLTPCIFRAVANNCCAHIKTEFW